MMIKRHSGLISIALALTVASACSDSSTLGGTEQQISATGVSTDQSSYVEGDSVTVSWTGTPGDPNDWVAIVPAGSPSDSGFIKFAFTGGAVDGMTTFSGSGLSAGSYEARAYASSSYTLLATSTFDVTTAMGSGSGGPVAVAIAQTGAGNPVTVSWTGSPGNSDDWVAIYPTGAANSDFIQWFFTNGQVDGSQVFNGLTVGTYDARLFQSGSYTVLGSTTFTVLGVSTDASSYAEGQPITVSWNGTPGNSDDWVAIFPAGSPADSGFVAWQFTNGQVDGSTQFAGLSFGDYEARVYLHGSYTILASTTFTVAGSPPPPPPPATITTDMTDYNAFDPITVSWTNSPGNAGDWVAIFPAGSPANSGFVQWFYTNGVVNGAQAFSGLDVGDYEARLYLAGTFTVDTSSTFSVIAGP